MGEPDVSICGFVNLIQGTSRAELVVQSFPPLRGKQCQMVQRCYHQGLPWTCTRVVQFSCSSIFYSSVTRSNPSTLADVLLFVMVHMLGSFVWLCWTLCSLPLVQGQGGNPNFHGGRHGGFGNGRGGFGGGHRGGFGGVSLLPLLDLDYGHWKLQDSCGLICV